MKSEKEKMLAGEPFSPADELLSQERLEVQARLHRLNTELAACPMAETAGLIAELLPNAAPGTMVRPPFYCDYGYNITCGEGVFINYNCTILDVGHVHIGAHVMIGPGVQIYAVSHPLDAAERKRGEEWGEPVTIGDDCWIGGAAVICPGVTIGARSVVGAGAVVTRDVPEDTVVAGNPARVIRRLR